MILFRSFWFIDSIVNSINRSSNVSNFNQWQSNKDWYLQQKSDWRIHVGIQTIISQRPLVGQTPRKNCPISQKRIDQKLTRYANFIFWVIFKVKLAVVKMADLIRKCPNFGRITADVDYQDFFTRCILAENVQFWPQLVTLSKNDFDPISATFIQQRSILTQPLAPSKL